MTVQAVDAHVDRCDGTPPTNKRPTTSSILLPSLQKPAAKPERLPHPHYTGLKDVALRRKLADQGIPSFGPRQLMERRYSEWVMLWNANCDSKNPKGKTELKRELDTWERTQGGKAATGGREQLMGAQIKDKDFDGKAWAEKHDEAFKELIAKAREKAAAKVTVPEPTVIESAVDGSTQTVLTSQPDITALSEQQRRGLQIQNNEQTPPQYRPTPLIHTDTAVSPDIGTIKPL